VRIEEIVAALEGREASAQASALDESAVVFHLVAEACVNALKRGPFRVIVAERIGRLGSVIIPRLEHVLLDDVELEAKIYAAIVLLQLGKKSSIDFLMENLKNAEEFVDLCAIHLVNSGMLGRELFDTIVHRIRKTPIENVDLIVALLSSAMKMPFCFPPDLALTLSHPSTPWQIRSFFDAESVNKELKTELCQADSNIQCLIPHFSCVFFSSSTWFFLSPAVAAATPPPPPPPAAAPATAARPAPPPRARPAAVGRPAGPRARGAQGKRAWGATRARGRAARGRAARRRPRGSRRWSPATSVPASSLFRAGSNAGGRMSWVNSAWATPSFGAMGLVKWEQRFLSSIWARVCTPPRSPLPGMLVSWWIQGRSSAGALMIPENWG
jgi:hypothetical protein